MSFRWRHKRVSFRTYGAGGFGWNVFPGLRPPCHPSDEDLSLGTPASADFIRGYFRSLLPGEWTLAVSSPAGRRRR